MMYMTCVFLAECDRLILVGRMFGSMLLDSQYILLLLVPKGTSISFSSFARVVGQMWPAADHI